jgi:pyrimidine-nucleoside phosphorylase
MFCVAQHGAHKPAGLSEGAARRSLVIGADDALCLNENDMRAYELIKSKRDGQTLSSADIQTFISQYTSGEVPDYQMSAMCMALFFRGMHPSELGAWTRAMLHSGEVLDLSEVSGVKVDKHSTGGVGDKVSLSLAPLVAACGVPVPMVSGRGLGHTGGTLDKLEAIAGFNVNLSVSEYRRLVGQVGACLIGQTRSIAPADKKLYALRDVTATVDCIPLIASSIMSKKLAEGIDALVLDVKVGNGAFMKSVERARELARTMIGLGQEMGKTVVALLTHMDEPLGATVGNALEVKEAVEMLRGKAPPDYTAVTLALSAEMLVIGKQAATLETAHERLNEAIASGKAEQKLREIVIAQGGDVRVIDDLSRLPQSRLVETLLAPRAGFVTGFHTEAVGHAAMALGAGRERAADPVDHAVGFVLHKKRGDAVEQGEPLVTLHVNDESRIDNVKMRLLKAIDIGDVKPDSQPLILERIAVA